MRKGTTALFKLDFSQIGKGPALSGIPYGWLDEVPSHEHHMGLERNDEMQEDLEKLERACAEQGLTLPGEFRAFMRSPDLWRKFRSVNAGFFDLRNVPVKCPIGEGHLIPFIADQQYCHYHFLHLMPGQVEYEIVWAEDLKQALYASPKVFQENYQRNFDKYDIYLCDNNFEHFMRGHYEDNEKWFAEHGYG